MEYLVIAFVLCVIINMLYVIKRDKNLHVSTEVF